MDAEVCDIYDILTFFEKTKIVLRKWPAPPSSKCSMLLSNLTPHAENGSALAHRAMLIYCIIPLAKDGSAHAQGSYLIPPAEEGFVHAQRSYLIPPLQKTALRKRGAQI